MMGLVRSTVYHDNGKCDAGTYIVEIVEIVEIIIIVVVVSVGAI